MKKLVFATIANEINRAFRKKMIQPDLVKLLYKFVANPLDKNETEISKGEYVYVDKGQACNILNQKGTDGNIHTYIQEHVDDQLVMDNIEKNVEEKIFKGLDAVKTKILINNIINIIQNDNTMDEEKRQELLSFAKEEKYAKFIGHSLLYSFTVPNVPVENTACIFFEERIKQYSQNEKHKLQKDTREKLISWLKEDNIRKSIEEHIQALQAGQKDLRKKVLRRFETEKENLSPDLVTKIKQEFKNKQDSKAILLLILGNIYGNDISSLSFLYKGTEKNQAPPKEVPVEMSEYAKCVLATRLPSTLTKIESVFSFRSDKIAFQGRKEERNRLESWLNQGFVSVWAVTGQGGSGKSKLALCFAADMEKQRKAKAVWMDKALLKQFLEYNDFSYSQPVLFICDYASQFGDQLKELIDKMSWTQTNAKFLLLERSDVWYRDFLLKNDAVKERAVKEPIILDHLDFEPDEYAAIMQDYSDALNDKEPKQIPEAAQQQIIQKAKELSGKESSARCLFLLLVTDAYLKNADIRYLNAQNLLHNYLEHSREILKKHYEVDFIDAGYRVLAYATACEGIPYSEMKNHPAIQNEWDTIKKQLKGRHQINQFFQRMSEIDDEDIVPAMKPDLIGEFLFLHEWNDLMDEQEAWFSELLRNDYALNILSMCLTDWPIESKSICAMLSGQNADAKQRAACAEVFNLAVREVQSEEKQKEYAAKIKALDHDHSAAVLKKYTDVIRFIFEHAAKDTRKECAALLDDVNWTQYSPDTKEELHHLADAYSDAAGVYQDMGDYDKALEYYNKALVIFEKVLGTEHPSTATTYNSIALVYKAKGDYDKALEYYNKALVIVEKVLGKEHPSTATTYHNIAGVYKAKGDYDKALEYYNKALAVKEIVLGTEHPDTAKTYNNIALVYKAKGDYDKALEYYNKALAVKEIVLGTEHPSTATTYNGIAVVYQDMGDYDKALEYYKKDLAISEKVLGTEHPDTATTYNNIAVVYQAKGDYDKALEYYNKALVIVEKVLGTEHPSTATTYHNIALVYKAKGDYDKALEYYNKALVIVEKVLGKEHPDTATTYNSIALVYKAKGDYDKALEYYKKDLAISEKVLGTEHPSTATTYNNIAVVYQDMGDYDKALEYYNKALVIVEKVLGKEHPDTATTYNNIAVVSQDMGDYDKALEYYKKDLAISEKVLGTEHPSTATTYNNIAVVSQDMGDYDKALEYYNKALVIFEKVLGTEHPSTATTYHNIAGVYKAMGDYDKALEYYKKDLAISEKVLGKEHPDTATTYNGIAGVYQAKGDYDKALEYYNKALVIFEKVLGTEHPSTATTYHNIAGVYKAMGDYDKALEYYRKDLAISEKVLGTEHPNTGATYHDLGDLLCETGKLDDALEYTERAKKIFERKFGVEHLRTARTFNLLARIYLAKGDANAALNYAETAKDNYAKKGLTEHPDVAINFRTLAEILLAKNDSEQAKAYAEQALEILEKKFNKTHLETRKTYQVLADIYEKTGCTEKAAEYRRKAEYLE